MASLMLNLCVAAVEDGDREGCDQLLTTLCILFLGSITDPEARFRVLVALGTLLASAANFGITSVADSARDFNAAAGVEAWRTEASSSQQYPTKVAECAVFVLSYL